MGAAGYGIHERERSGDQVARHAEQIRLVGYTVVPSGLSAAQVEDLGVRLDAVLAQQVDEFGGAARLAAIGDALTARCVLAYDEAFLELATHPDVRALCRNLLGDYFVLMQQNGVINPPSETHQQQAYHRDLPYQHFVSSRPLAISVLFCIDPFRPDTGATTVLPASHRVEAFPSDETAAALDTSVGADAGSFIVFDSMLFHRAGSNRSGRPRRGVNHVFSVPIIAQQISLPAMLKGKYADDPALARLLGYESGPADSVIGWRERRLARRSS
jgi:ectoine hydroxylase-related dioxygenase (phytanoyl-CoA dioxygenase family)